MMAWVADELGFVLWVLYDIGEAILCPIWMTHCVLSHCKWYRRTLGGHWELWNCHATLTHVWVRLGDCTQRKDQLDIGARPGACGGRPFCEDYE